MFSFDPKSSRTGSKNFHNSRVVGHKKLPDSSLSKFFNFVTISLRLSSYLNDVIFAWNTSLQLCQKVSYQNSRLVYEIFQFLKQAVFATWHGDSNLFITMGLKRKIEYSWKCTFWTSYCFKGCINLSLAWDGVTYNVLLIGTGMTTTFNKQFYY